VGTQESRLADETVRTLGGRPGWFALGRQLPTRFAAIEQQVHTVRNYVKTGYETVNVGLWPRANVVVANRAVFRSLSPANRRALRRAARASAAGETAFFAGWARQETRAICEEGVLKLVRASAEDVAALRRAVRPVYERLERDTQARRAIAAIEAMRRGVRREPPPRCPAVEAAGRTTPEARAAVRRIAGRYETTVGDADVGAVVARASERLHRPLSAPSEAGFRVVLDLALDGRFAVAQRPDGWRLTGTYAAGADTIALKADGEAKADTILRWSVYHGGLPSSPSRAPSRRTGSACMSGGGSATPSLSRARRRRARGFRPTASTAGWARSQR
jgi:hypothetical protein